MANPYVRDKYKCLELTRIQQILTCQRIKSCIRPNCSSACHSVPSELPPSYEKVSGQASSASRTTGIPRQTSKTRSLTAGARNTATAGDLLQSGPLRKNIKNGWNYGYMSSVRKKNANASLPVLNVQGSFAVSNPLARKY